MAFTNSEQIYGRLTFQSSGSALQGVTTGPGVLFGVVTSLQSGVGVPNAGTFMVYDATSGIAPAGATKLYYFVYTGANSGGVMPPDALGINAPFLSGLNVYNSGAANVALTLNYRLGI